MAVPETSRLLIQSNSRYTKCSPFIFSTVAIALCVCVRARVIVYTHLCQCLCEMKAVQLSLDQSSKILVLCLVLVSSRFIIFSSGAQFLSLLTEHLRGNGNISKTPKICRHMVTPFYSCGPCRVQTVILIVIRTSLECLL